MLAWRASLQLMYTTSKIYEDLYTTPIDTRTTLIKKVNGFPTYCVLPFVAKVRGATEQNGSQGPNQM